MLTQEKFAVAAIVLAAAVYLVRVTVANHRKRHTEGTCAGCGCGKTLQIVNRNVVSPAAAIHPGGMSPVTDGIGETPGRAQRPPASIRRSPGK